MSLIVSDLPWPAQQQGAPIAAEYLRGLRLVIDGGAQYPQALSFSESNADGFRVVGTTRVGGSGRGWSGAASTYVSARTTASNPSPLFEIPANSDWTAQFVIDNVSGVSGTNFGFFRAGETFVGTTFIVQSGNDRRPWMRVNGTDVLRPASGPQWTTGQTLNLIARFRNASRAEFWWNGRLQHAATHSASQNVLFGTAGIYALLMQNGSEITGGNLAAFRFWTRYLDDSQTQALAQSEHALYEPLRIWVPGGAAGGIASSAGASTGVAVAAATGQSTSASVGAVSGVATASATGLATTAGAGAATGAATATAASSATSASPGASSAAATATAVGSSTHAAVGASTGAATAVATSAGGGAATGTSSGAAAASAVGAATHAAVGSSTGAATVTAFTAGTSAGSGASAGEATAAATGVGLGLAAGASAGAASATAAAQAVSQATGAASAAATASATATSTASAAASSAGGATAIAYSAGVTAAVGTCAANAAAAAIGVAMITPDGVGDATVEVGSELRYMLVPTDFHTMSVSPTTIPATL